MVPLAGKCPPLPENGPPGRETVPLAGKRYISQENVTHDQKTLHMAGERFSDFRKRGRVCDPNGYSHISTNLIFSGVISKFRRIGQLGMKTLSFGRGTLRATGNVFLISENISGFRGTRQTSRPKGL